MHFNGINQKTLKNHNMQQNCAKKIELKKNFFLGKKSCLPGD